MSATTAQQPDADPARQPQAKPAPRATTAQRTCWWQIRPWTLPDGRVMGALGMRVGKKCDFYRVLWLNADDMSVQFEVAKELPDGSYQEAYRVVLPAPGCFGRPVCSCEGWRRYGKCRHGDSLAAILSRDLAGGVEGATVAL